MDDPTNDAAIEEVARAAALPVKPMIACPSDIRAAIRVYYFGETAPAPAPAAVPGADAAPPSSGAPTSVPGGASLAPKPASVDFRGRTPSTHPRAVPSEAGPKAVPAAVREPRTEPRTRREPVLEAVPPKST